MSEDIKSIRDTSWSDLINHRDIVAKLADESIELQHEVYNLLWVIAAREYGVQAAVSTMETVISYMNSKTEGEAGGYAFKSKIIPYTETLMDLYLLHNLINLFGLDHLRDPIMDLAIGGHFGRSNQQQKSVRMDRRDLITLASTLSTVKVDKKDMGALMSVIKSAVNSLQESRNAKRPKKRKPSTTDRGQKPRSEE